MNSKLRSMAVEATIMSTRTAGLALALVLAVTCLTPSVAVAQDAVTLVLVDQLPTRGLVAEVRRREDAEGSTEILMKRSAATPELLNATLNSLHSSWVRHPQHRGVLVIKFSESLRLAPVSGETKARLLGVIGAARSSPNSIAAVANGVVDSPGGTER